MVDNSIDKLPLAALEHSVGCGQAARGSPPAPPNERLGQASSTRPLAVTQQNMHSDVAARRRDLEGLMTSVPG